MRTKRNPSRAFALIIVLFLVVVLSSILIAFVTIMMSDRQATQNYSQGLRAEQVARGAFVSIQSQLIQEIADKSTRYGADGTTAGAAPYLYWPLNATNMVPQPSGLVSAPPLVKMSKFSSNFYSGGASLASDASTTTPAPNGRLYSLARWNKPQFFTNWPSTLPAPDWVNVTRVGPQVVTVDEAKNAALSNDKFVVGRYAYTVYDTGGLLNINEAGYSTATTPAPGTDLAQPFLGQKGCLALADLTQIPTNGGTGTMTQAQVNALVQWRDQKTWTNTVNYLTNYLNTNGGLAVYPGNNTFINRQDLITYAQVNGFTNALPYFSTFSRSLNAPSYCPDADAPVGGAYAYKTSAFNAITTNYCLPNVRVKVSGWSRLNDDGTTTPAVVGEPLVNKRFPLSRLALMSLTVPTTADLNKISTYFGLTIDPSNSVHAPWKYTALAAGNSIDPNVHICTLGEVAALGREPNFFELLKSTILSGSTGRDPGNCYTPATGANAAPRNEVELESSTMDLHIFRIGVNIIDQYGSSNFPTTIDTQLFTAGSFLNDVYGIKFLPYFSRVNPYLMDQTPPAFDGSVSYSSVWLQPVIFNPHQEKALLATGPTKLRIQAFGSSAARVTIFTSASTPPTISGALTSVGGAASYWNGSSIDTDSSHPFAYIPFNTTATNFCAGPVPMCEPLIDPATSATNRPGLLSPANWTSYPQPVGFGLPPAACNPNAYTKSFVQPWAIDWQNSVTWHGSSGNPALGTFFALQWQDGAVWRTYQTVNSIQNLRSGGSFKLANYNTTTGSVGSIGQGDGNIHYDPRTGRLGMATPLNTAFAMTNTIRPATALGVSFIQGYPVAPVSSGGSFNTTALTPFSGSGSFFGGAFSQNTNNGVANNMYYSDRDNVIRGADGVLATGVASSLPNGYPLATNNTTGSQRPLVLNRPFRSVGELGYTFRDEPFKSLDFFTDKSGDSGLLDVFSVDSASLNSGKVNLNRAPGPVIKALISGGLRKETDTSKLFNTTADLNNVATYLSNQLATTPMINRGDLVKALAGMTLSATEDNINKTQRETPIRALAEVADTRTWNLLIDIVAQAGRYPPKAGSLAGDFQVQGEKRYWLHLSIDRLTGQILASQLEPVYE